MLKYVSWQEAAVTVRHHSFSSMTNTGTDLTDTCRDLLLSETSGFTLPFYTNTLAESTNDVSLSCIAITTTLHQQHLNCENVKVWSQKIPQKKSCLPLFPHHTFHMWLSCRNLLQRFVSSIIWPFCLLHWYLPLLQLTTSTQKNYKNQKVHVRAQSALKPQCNNIIRVVKPENISQKEQGLTKYFWVLSSSRQNGDTRCCYIQAY